MFPSHSKRICKRDKSTVGAPHGTAMLASLWFVTSASWCPFISHWDKLTRKCQLLAWLILYGTVTKTHLYLFWVQSRNLTDQLTYITLTVKRFCQWKQNWLILFAPHKAKVKGKKVIAELFILCFNSESNNSFIAFYSSLLWTFTFNLSSRLEGNDISEICKKNLSAAMTIGRKDLVQTWSLLSLVLDKKLAPSDSMDESPWALHPFGRKMVSSLWVCFIYLRIL